MKIVAPWSEEDVIVGKCSRQEEQEVVSEGAKCQNRTNRDESKWAAPRCMII